MTAAPLFTIAMVTRNHGQFIRQAIESCLANEMATYEILVVDDGSDDDTAHVVQSLNHIPGLRYVNVGKIGLVAARNESLRLARGQFIVCLDSDDLLVPTLLDAYQRLLIDNPGVDVIYGNLVATDAALNRIGEFTYQPVPDFPHGAQHLFAMNRVPHPGSAARISLVREVGGYREGMDGAVDYALWLDLAVARARFVHVPAHVAFYRRHSGNISGDAARVHHWDRSVIASAVARFTDQQLFPALDWSNRPRATLAATAIGCARMLETGCDTETIHAYMCSRLGLAVPALEESVC